MIFEQMENGQLIAIGYDYHLTGAHRYQPSFTHVLYWGIPHTLTRIELEYGPYTGPEYPTGGPQHRGDTK